MLSNKHKTFLKQVLQNRQAVLMQQLENKETYAQPQMEQTGDIVTAGNHPGDAGTELYDREKDLALYEHAEVELAKINEALHALADGTYGICKVCHNMIAYDRLLAMPMTDTCVNHATVR